MKGSKLILASVFLFFLNSTAADDVIESSSIYVELQNRIERIENRLDMLEGKEKVVGVEIEEDVDSSDKIVDVYLVEKKMEKDNFYPAQNLIFDIKFVGTSKLGKRKIKDIKGAVIFQDAFGETIVAATATERLNIGAGESKVIRGKMVPWLELQGPTSKWSNVVTTDIEEIILDFEVESVIFDESVRLDKSQIQKLQIALTKKGFDAGTPDGLWGSSSRSALIDFQTKEGLKATGYPDQETLDKLGVVVN